MIIDLSTKMREAADELDKDQATVLLAVDVCRWLCANPHQVFGVEDEIWEKAKSVDAEVAALEHEAGIQ